MPPFLVLRSILKVWKKAYKQLSLSPKANTEPDKNWVNKLKKISKIEVKMSENVKEIIELYLKTNFDKELRRSTSAYDGFTKTVNSTSKTLAKNISTMYRNIVSTVTNTGKKMSQEMNSSLSKTTEDIGQVKHHIKEVTASLRELESLKSKQASLGNSAKTFAKRIDLKKQIQ